MIQIDDSGWGCPIGSTIIGALRVESHEYTLGIIPIEQFQGDAFKQGAYLIGAKDVTATCLKTLRHVPTEPIQICTGYVHTATREWLTAQGYKWTPAKITGTLQSYIECSLRGYLSRLGFDPRSTTEEYGGLFYEAIVWLKGGDPDAPMVPERIALAKSGWDSFPFYRDLSYAEARAASKRFKARRQRYRRHR